MKRRDLFVLTAAAPALTGQAKQSTAPRSNSKTGGLPLEQFQPKSTLVVPETKVARARFPVIDFHTHVTFSAGLSGPMDTVYRGTPEECLPVMDRRNIQTLVNLTGGYGPALKQVIGALPGRHPGRFVVFTEPAWRKVADSNY